MHDLLNKMPLPCGAVWHKFEAGHLDLIDDNLAPDAVMRVVDNSSRGPSCTLFVKGQALVSVGMLDCRNGSGEVWAVIDKRRRHQHALLLTRSVRKSIDIAMRSMGLESANMFVECRRADAVRWAIALGFVETGKLTIYNQPQQDHFIFSRSL